MRPAVAFIILVMMFLLFFCALYHAFLYHFELEALNSLEVISSAELALAHYKHAVAAIGSCILGIGVLFAFFFWCHRLSETGS